jgi:PKD repeat protein
VQNRAWNFGDGANSSATSPAHVYTTPGTYTVTLTASGPGGNDAETKVGLVSVQFPPPVANFLAAPTSGVAPLSVQFTNTTSGTAQSFAWSFGDGASSSAASPAHVYATPGTYTVTLTATGPGGADGETKLDLVHVQFPPPVADFDVTPREGYAPLEVAFTDTSSGTCSSWSWNFGDGETSNLRSPLHVFSAPGSYSVLLGVSGPGGGSTRRHTIVARPATLFADGSFEAQVAGLAPRTPWTVYNGGSVLVRSVSAADHGFPSAGNNWCDIGAEGTSHARPPSNPGGAGSAPTGTAGIQQDFQFPADTHFFFDAAFLLNGPKADEVHNDFMSVDVTDGVTTWNLYYSDSFSQFPALANNGLAMTAVEHVHVDLARLYPTADATTVLSLRASLGNVGGGGFPSRGYVDAFRFALSAKATFRNGQGINPAFYGSSPPVVGGTWGIEIDSSVLPGARQVLIVARTRALGGPRLLGGEALIGGASLFTLAFPCSGGQEHFEVAIPGSAALVGRTLATQAVLTGHGTRLGNAFDLVLGY